MNILVVGDTVRIPELRHEIPLGIPDPFTYAELDGRRVVAVSSLEAPRVEGLGLDLEVHPLEEFGLDELRRSGIDPRAFLGELVRRIAAGLGIRSAAVPAGFPLAVAEALRADGVELRVDQKLFDDRRRRKSEVELAGIRRAQRAAEAGLEVARDLLRRAEPADGQLLLDGEPLTCELVKQRILGRFLELGAVAVEMIVSHGPQTAIGHEMGSGPIAPGEPVVCDLWPMDLASACYADLTRTLVVGDPPEEIRSWHALCREALELAASEARAGVDGRELHRLVCERFAEEGFPTQRTKADGEVLQDGFIHGLGHGVGLEVHEAPILGMIGEELVVGDVITIEPGLYRFGFGGVRVEDLFLVTEDGCERLTDCPYDLEV
ncbi:MAG: Xaa-Pro peptidase family protein [Thermoleophilia bacterium]|nr:Xaa-Pro peptidase family protein [Gaiellaceae bacterium]MDW8338395.1 Xaa-Pro peptidase family protein [Thermoleophilia bacterium]